MVTGLILVPVVENSPLLMYTGTGLEICGTGLCLGTIQQGMLGQFYKEGLIRTGPELFVILIPEVRMLNWCKNKSKA